MAGLSFLGFGLQPPAADWGLMINENRNGLTIQPWPVLLPVIAIALLTIGTSLIGDGISRAAIGIERGQRRAGMRTAPPSLEVVDLRVEVDYGGHEDIVDEITFQVAAGEVVGLVGESGCGKTTTGLAVLGHTRRGARIAGGQMRLGDATASDAGARAPAVARQARVSYVAQDPAAALSPACGSATRSRRR